MRKTLVSQVLKMLDFKGKVGLDVGCAHGFLANLLAKEGVENIVGCDISKTAVNRAKSQAKTLELTDKTTFLTCDAHELPFKDESYDFVICAEVLEHLQDPQKAAAELTRVLKKGGTLLATAPNIVNLAEITHTLKHLLFFLVKKEPITHISHFTYFSFPKLFKNLKIIDRGGWHMFTPFLPSLGDRINYVDLKLGELLYLIAFDLYVVGEKI